MKLSRLVDERLHVALNKLSSQPLPLKSAFKLKGIMQRAREEYAKYEDVRKQGLANYGEKNEDGSIKVNAANNVVFSEEGMEAFLVALNELTALDIDIGQLKIEELGEQVVLSTEDLESLEGIVVE